MSLCTCTDPVKNFGQPNCTGILERPQKMAFVHTKADDGSVNTILSTDTIDTAFIEARLNETDTSKRWFLTQDINQVNDNRAENNKFEVDGFQINTSEGVRTVAFTQVDGASPQARDSWNSLGCRDISFWTWSVTGQIGGNGKIATELRPVRIKKKTLEATYQPPSKENNTPAMVLVKFDLHENENDGDIAFIDDSGTGPGFIETDILSFDGLVDIVMGAATSITVTSFTVDIDLIYGNHFNQDPAEGFVLADFTYEELTPAPGPIVITSVTESSPGVYDFVVPVAASTETFRLTFSKTGFEPAGTIDILIP